MSALTYCRRIQVVLLAAGLLGALATSAAFAAETVPLNRVDPKQTTVGALDFKGAVVIPSGKVRIGGLSGLWVHPQTGVLSAISDEGRVVELTPQWSGQGTLIDVEINRQPLLLNEQGEQPKSRRERDSESISRLAAGAGDWLVGYERLHRIARFADENGKPTGAPLLLSLPAEITGLESNSGLESLAVLPDGRLFLLAEQTNRKTGAPFWVGRLDDHNVLVDVVSGTYQPMAGLVPVDAAALPSGDVVVLERGFSLFFTFRSRLVLLKAEQLVNLSDGQSLQGQVLAMLESPLMTENFEGVAVQARSDGKMRLFLVSDNNFNAAQQTILAAFEIISDKY
jgi:hypothetical protein